MSWHWSPTSRTAAIRRCSVLGRFRPQEEDPGQQPPPHLLLDLSVDGAVDQAGGEQLTTGDHILLPIEDRAQRRRDRGMEHPQSVHHHRGPGISSIKGCGLWMTWPSRSSDHARCRIPHEGRFTASKGVRRPSCTRPQNWKPPGWRLRSAMRPASVDIAISAGVREPMFRPSGRRMRPITSSGTPSLRSASTWGAGRRGPPMTPM